MSVIDKPLYKPNATDIEWANRMLDSTSDGGVLSFPSAQLIYEVDHDKKILTLQNPERLVSHFDSFVTHQQTKIVFAQIGYR